MWRFWAHEEAFAYISFYLALHWDLCVASMKKMAPLFSSFDHFTYRAQHLADVLCFPAHCLQRGDFVVSIIDEAHEMLINKACKTSVVRDYIGRIANYLPY